ncbi:DUF302 domain-containing protein [Thiomicrorhabdus sp. Kp2]|uniref:DUF302 domain-containing protein n=1 Tax=Thiomicrorhabdus sp. Kp2 TaxID=1123518 RepID=UPI0004242F75|nr:DUF302 domain-containing protein [Thiomicrorhabdus sp. Kp2]
MKRFVFTVLVMLVSVSSAYAVEGMVKVKSALTVDETVNKMQAVLEEKGMTIFNRINHSDAAHKVGINLSETVLLIFGNPKAGSLLMQCQQEVAIDLPLKALIWKDEKDQVWISYSDPRYLEQKYNIKGCETILSKMEKGLQGMVKLAVK